MNAEEGTETVRFRLVGAEAEVVYILKCLFCDLFVLFFCGLCCALLDDVFCGVSCCGGGYRVSAVEWCEGPCFLLCMKVQSGGNECFAVTGGVCQPLLHAQPELQLQLASTFSACIQDAVLNCMYSEAQACNTGTRGLTCKLHLHTKESNSFTHNL